MKVSSEARALLLGVVLFACAFLHYAISGCGRIAQESEAVETAGDGLTLLPGEATVISSGDSAGVTLVIANQYFEYRPQSDITPYEIALLLPLFTGVYYGMGEYSTGGAIVPIRDRMHGGWPTDTSIPIFKIDSYELSRLESASRHLVELPQ